MSIKKKGLGKGLDSLIPDNKSIKSVTPDKSAEAKKEAEEKAEAPADASAKPYQILAVTACPTGIAHTYMAAEGLEKKAKEMGVTIKVETNGSGGAKNVLTPEEIEDLEIYVLGKKTK